MKSEIDNFIGVFDFDIPDYCNDIVKFFDRVHNTNKTMNRQDMGNTQLDKDNDVYFFMNESDPILIPETSAMMKTFIDVVTKGYKLYKRKYGALDSLGIHKMNPDIKIQKTIPGQGYHMWHCEASEYKSARRLLLCMLYLNDVEEGGETEFLYQSKRIKPKTGRLVLCPAYFTHVHRGNPPLKGSKYMINGWMHLIDK